MSEMYYVHFGKSKLGKFQISVLDDMARKEFITSDTILERCDTGEKIRAGELESLSFPVPKPAARKWYIPRYWFWPAAFLLVLLAVIIGTVLGKIFH